MGPKRKSQRSTTNRTRAQGHAASSEMVRATSIFPSVPTGLGHVVDWIAHRYAGPLRARADFSTWQMMSPWRRLACHIFPIICALLLGYIAIELFGNRYPPRLISKAEIIPHSVQAGTPAEVKYTARDERSCSGRTRRWITDSTGVIYDLSQIYVFEHLPNESSSAEFTFVHEFPVPFGAHAGSAVLHISTTRWCNIFQEWLWPITSSEELSFEIIARVQ